MYITCNVVTIKDLKNVIECANCFRCGPVTMRKALSYVSICIKEYQHSVQLDESFNIRHYFLCVVGCFLYIIICYNTPCKYGRPLVL